jgi:hypothetical protein
MSESGIQQGISDFSAGQRLRRFVPFAVLLVFCPFLSYELARQAWSDPAMPIVLRAAYFAFSALLLFFFAYLFGSMLVRRIRTGRFLLTRADLLARNARIRERMGAGKPFWPQARVWLVGWILLAVLAAFGIAALVAAVHLCKCSLSETALLAALGLVFLVLPGMYVVKAIRRKYKTGSFLPSVEEIDQARAKCAQPKPLRQRILLAGIYWLVALLWTWTALSRHTHHHVVFGSVWALPAMWWMVAALWTWQMFRPRSAQCAIDPGLPPTIKPPAS